MRNTDKALEVLDVLKATQDLNKLQLRMVLNLYFEKALVHELAKAVGVSSAAISRSVDELERLGYAKRTRDEKGDRRQVYVALTSRGNKFIETALAQ